MIVAFFLDVQSFWFSCSKARRLFVFSVVMMLFDICHLCHKYDTLLYT